MTATTTLPPERIGITGKQERLVYFALAEDYPMTLESIRQFAIGHGEMIQETTVSARIRSINKKLKLNNFHMRIKRRIRKDGSRQYIYWLSQKL